MLKKMSNFIVNQKYLILALMLLLTVASVFMMQGVEINEDMTKYLPDDSEMKAGIDIMAEEFPEMEMSSTIRVMFDDLTDAQKDEVLSRLEAIEYVESVTYEADSADYNKDNHTLFVVNTPYEYGSAEELSIEAALDSSFTDHTMVWNNDDTSLPDIPVWVVVVALIVLMAILFIMCGSWIEPILFIAVIGVAIIINMGTNIILGSVSNITFSIAAILQLVLSMDYSIILMNRYRQEKELVGDKNLAMKEALAHAFSSVASSSLTTVVGLLMLVFMSFKIGMDLGIVLAKGVFISMICVLTMLPGVILACDKLITRTGKKTLHIPMGWAAAFSYKLRHVMGILLIVLFAGAYILQSQTGISYTLSKEDAVADVFPASNTLVMVYENQDEDQILDLVEKLEADEHIKSVTGYATMLAKPYTAEELAEEIAAMSEDMALNPSILKMLYYDYYTDGTTGTMTASDFLNFISDTVAGDETFSDYIDEDMLDSMDLIEKFADPEALTTPMNAAELAAFFDMDEGNINDLFLLYYIESGDASSGTMTLPVFVDFILNEVAVDETYGSMFDEATLSQLEQLKTFTDVDTVTSWYDYKSIAYLMGMDAETVKLIFVYYQALSESYVPETMTLPEFVEFLQTDVMNNAMFSSYLDESTKAQIGTLAQFTDKAALQAQQTPATLAGMLGMDESMVELLFVLHNAQDVSGKTMTLAQFTGFLNDSILSNPMFSGSFDDETKAQLQTMNSMVQLAASGQALTPAQMSGVLGMDEATLSQLYFLHLSANDTAFQQEMATMTMTLADFLALVKANAGEEQLAELTQLEQLITLASSGQGLTPAQMSGVLGMDEATVTQLYFLYLSTNDAAFQQEMASMTMTLPEFVALAKTQTTNDQLTQLGSIIDIAVSNQALSAAEVAAITGMDEASISAIFGYQSQQTETEVTEMTLQEFLNVALSMQPDNAQLQQLSQIVNLAVSGTALDAASLAGIFGMETAQVQQLFGLSLAAQKTISLPVFTKFLVNTVMADETYGAAFTETQKAQLTQMNQMVQLAASGTAVDAATLASIFGMETSQVQQLFGLTLAPQKAIPLATFTDFLVNSVMTNEAYSGSFTEEQKAQLATLNGMVQLAAANTGLNTASLAQTFGMDESMVTLIFRLYYGSDITGKTMSLEEMVDFILSDSAMQSFLDSESLSQLQMMQKMINATINGTEFTYSGLASLLGMESDILKMLFTYHDSESKINSWYLSLQTIVNFLVNNSDQFGGMMDSSQISQLKMVRNLINGTVNGTSYTASGLASLVGIDSSDLEQLFLLYTSRHGDTSEWKLSVKGFIDFINSEVLSNPDYADQFDEETADMLTTAQVLVDAVISGTSYTSGEMSELLSGFSEELDGNMMDLIYLYAEGSENADPTWTMSMETLFNYMVSDVLQDPRFESLIEEDMREDLLAAQVELEDGKAQLVTDNHSRLIITSSYPEESAETTAFLSDLGAYCVDNMNGNCYFIGNSAMTYEMQQTFDSELLFITLLTAIAIFLIVALTFKSLSIPLILVLLVQCGVYITVSVTGMTDGSMYYLALLIVECILMGATIDYGILLTNYYCEARRTMSVKEALGAAYTGSNHTILTSGLILILVTAIVGNFFEEPTVSEIVKTVSVGALCATVLILFVLPGVLAVCDKVIIKKRKEEKV